MKNFVHRNDRIFFFFLSQTEKEDQTGFTGQDRDNQQQAIESNYYDEGPSIMPSSENFAGNRDNWGASAEGWNANAAGTGESNEWTATTAGTTAVQQAW